tara:strand:+ start:1799 stop:2296 length:498 start_codon:yes stop_codon:yes gene_type:complete
MFDITKPFNKLIKDVKESSPNFRKSIAEISPVSFCLNIEGHKNIYINLNKKNSDIGFEQNNHQFEIKASLVELLQIIVSGKINKSLINGDSELAIILLNAIYKSNIDFIYLIDKYFGNLPAVFTYAIVNKVFNTPEVYRDNEQRKIRKRLRDLAIRLDRLEAIKI